MQLTVSNPLEDTMKEDFKGGKIFTAQKHK